MRFDIMTLFPEAVSPMLNASILGRAQKKGLIEIHAHQIRDYTVNRQNQVDDYPYGGGRGAIMQCDPLWRCWCAVCDEIGAPVHTIFLSPCGPAFDQAKARQLEASYDNLILVCGHYEGVDQRFLDECVDEEISMGDFVLTGGEIPAMAIVDAVSRLDEWHGLSVPEVLRSGDHAKVARWQKKQAILRTLHRRPDLFYTLRFPYKTRAERKFIAELEAEDDAFRDRNPKNLDYRK